MLFERRFWEPMRDGTVTVTFRRWRRPQAVAGRRYRSPLAILLVDSVDIVSEPDITETDAVAAGYESRDALLADLRGDIALPLYRIRFHPAPGGDPRAELADSDKLSDDDIRDIDRRLARLDRASPHGPWTTDTLRLIARRPATRAGDLATEVGREMAPFKLDVRKLKELGLTISLGVGYQLSRRGEAYLAAKAGERANGH